MGKINHYQLDAVILCGGKGSRLGGQNKGLIPFQQKPLAVYQKQKIQPFCQHVIINTNQDHKTYQKYQLDPLSDLIGGYAGPLAGIHSAMEKLDKQETTHLLVLAVDYPHLKAETFSRLIEQSQYYPDSIISAWHQQQTHPLISIFPLSLKKDLQQALNKQQYGVCYFLQQHKTRYVDFSRQPLYQWENINYPEQLYNKGIATPLETK